MSAKGSKKEEKASKSLKIFYNLVSPGNLMTIFGVVSKFQYSGDFYLSRVCKFLNCDCQCIIQLRLDFTSCC